MHTLFGGSGDGGIVVALGEEVVAKGEGGVCCSCCEAAAECKGYKEKRACEVL